MEGAQGSSKGDTKSARGGQDHSYQRFHRERVEQVFQQFRQHEQIQRRHFHSQVLYRSVEFLELSLFCLNVSFSTEQFSKYANVFFLFTALIQQIPNVSPTNKYTTIAPLALVLLVAAFKEIQEDLVSRRIPLSSPTLTGTLQKRHQSDSDLNSRLAKVLVGTQFEDKPWRSIKVGDIVRLESNDFFPADLIILSSSEPEGLCYIETSNLDGYARLLFAIGTKLTLGSQGNESQDQAVLFLDSGPHLTDGDLPTKREVAIGTTEQFALHFRSDSRHSESGCDEGCAPRTGSDFAARCAIEEYRLDVRFGRFHRSRNEIDEERYVSSALLCSCSR